MHPRLHDDAPPTAPSQVRVPTDSGAVPFPASDRRPAPPPARRRSRPVATPPGSRHGGAASGSPARRGGAPGTRPSPAVRPGRRGGTSRGSAPKPRVDFRPDVEGLRAVAVVLVVAFHAGLPQLAGGFVGVDVFFVISGFLITGLVVDELLKTGTVSISNFYARRVRRLLPAACTVLVVTAIVFNMVLPAIDQPALAGDLIAAALWFANWHFAAASTDYFAGTAEHSPVLHFWSLSVEEQFYLFWPLLVVLVAGTRGRRRGLDLALGAARTARRARRDAGPPPPGREHQTGSLSRPSPRIVVRRVALALLPLGLLSLLVSAVTTAASGPWAYFGVHTRAWELAAGGAVALARGYLYRLSPRGASSLGWVGLAMIVLSALAMDSSTPFPGTWALVPVLGAAAVLAAGARTQTGIASVLSRGWLTYIGRVSYSWYLWHWPCLELARRLTAPPTLDEFGVAPQAPPLAILVAVAASFLLATATYTLIEQPARSAKILARSKPRTFAFTAAVVSAAVVVPWALLARVDTGATTDTNLAQSVSATTDVVSSPAPTRATRTKNTVTAAALPKAQINLGRVPTMTPEQGREDAVEFGPCFVSFESVEAVDGCRFGDPDGERVLVLVGDSHAAHWFPAMEAAAKANGWQLHYWAKAACGYSDVPQYLHAFKRSYDECTAWRANVTRRITDLPRVDAVFVGRSSTYLGQVVDGGEVADQETATRLWGEGATRTMTALVAGANRVYLLRDSPRPGADVPECLSSNPSAPQNCAYPRSPGSNTYPDGGLFEAESEATAIKGVRILDLTPVVCSTDPCPVISAGGAIMFRDGNHLTETYSREMAKPVATALAAALK